MALWHDKRGRFSPLRAATLVMLFLPALALLYFTATHDLGPRPRTEAIHEVGLWGIRFLLLDLFITPLRRIGRYAALIDVRRMIGVGVFCYMVLHLVLYAADQMFDMVKVVSEIALRYYLTIGFAAWLGLAALAVTSNDRMVRKLGGIRWRKLHQLVYPIAILGTIHYFMQAKLEVFEPTVIGGLFAWLLIYRLMHWRFPRGGEFPLWILAASWFGIGAAVFLLEALGFHIAFGVPMTRILAVDFDFHAGIRPGWYIWGTGLVITLIGLWRLRPESRPAQFAASSAGRTPN